MTAERATSNPHLIRWVEESARLLKPDRVFWCDGSKAEFDRLMKEAVADGTFIPLDQTKWPGCYYHHSNPNDVARVEHLTFICTPTKEEAGPTNNWMEPAEARHARVGPLRRRHEGAHHLRRAVRDGPGQLALRQGGRARSPTPSTWSSPWGS